MCIIFKEAKEKVKRRFAPTVVFRERRKIFFFLFSCCFFYYHISISLLFSSGINISIIEPSWFSFRVAMWRLNSLPSPIFFSIFSTEKYFFVGAYQKVWRKFIFLGRVNICLISSFLFVVSQEMPQIFNHDWSDKGRDENERKEERTRREVFVCLMILQQ